MSSGATIDGPSLGYRSQPAPHAAFVAMIQRMDRDIGRLTDLIGKRNIDRNTLIIFTSDNGPHKEGGGDPEFFKSSGPLRGIKRDLYEGGIRVPMIARWTGTIPASRVSYHEWAHWDILPTLAELAGAKTPAGLDGMSMARALRGEQQPTHDFFYWEFHERGFQQAVRMGDWKAVRLKKDAPLELYDLPDDPLEAHDLSAGNPGRRRADREVPGDGADGLGAVADQVGIRTRRLGVRRFDAADPRARTDRRLRAAGTRLDHRGAEGRGVAARRGSRVRGVGSPRFAWLRRRASTKTTRSSTSAATAWPISSTTCRSRRRRSSTPARSRNSSPRLPPRWRCSRAGSRLDDPMRKYPAGAAGLRRRHHHPPSRASHQRPARLLHAAVDCRPAPGRALRQRLDPAPRGAADGVELRARRRLPLLEHRLYAARDRRRPRDRNDRSASSRRSQIFKPLGMTASQLRRRCGESWCGDRA